MRRIVFGLVAVGAVAGGVATMALALGQSDGEGASIFEGKIPPGYRDWRLISVAHEAGSLDDLRAILSKTPGAVTPEALAAYTRTYSEPAAIHAVCEDYRAAAGIDSRLLTAARAAGQKMTPPLPAIWGGKGTVGQDFDVVGLWEQEAATVSGHPLPCGHLIPEEDPDGLLASLDAFLTR